MKRDRAGGEGGNEPSAKWSRATLPLFSSSILPIRFNQPSLGVPPAAPLAPAPEPLFCRPLLLGASPGRGSAMFPQAIDRECGK